MRLAFLLALSFGPISAHAVEFNGYFRTGVGGGKGGRAQPCFQVPGRDGAPDAKKHRLGNECDTYLELAATKEFKGASEDQWFDATVRVSFKTLSERDYENTAPYDHSDAQDTTHQSDLDIALREAFGRAHGVLGKGTALWVGKRFYRRIDLHMLDYYLLDNTGPGFGVEDLSLGSSKLHLALTRHVPRGAGPLQNNLDVRVSQIPFLSGSLETILIYGRTSEEDAKTGARSYESLTGVMGMTILEHTFGAHQNRFIAQYGTGLYGSLASWGGAPLLSQWGDNGSQNIPKGASDLKGQREGSSALRLANQFFIHPLRKKFSLSMLVFYQSLDFNGQEVTSSAGQARPFPHKTELTAGVRPAYHVSDTFSLIFEVGASQIKNGVYNSGDDEFLDIRGEKYTIAPSFDLGKGYWARPSLRFFVTHATWNQEAKGQVVNGTYADHRQGTSLGVQFEAWW